MHRDPGKEKNKISKPQQKIKNIKNPQQIDLQLQQHQSIKYKNKSNK
jgi:hypothetical protein